MGEGGIRVAIGPNRPLFRFVESQGEQLKS